MRRTVVPNLSRDANTDDGVVFQYIVKEKVHGWAIVGVSVVICGLAVKASEVLGADGNQSKTSDDEYSDSRRSVRVRIGDKLLYERYFDGILVEIDKKSTEW